MQFIQSIVVWVIFLLPFYGISQVLDTLPDGRAFELIEGDTILLPGKTLEEFVYDEDFQKEWRRAVYFVRRVYPYAQIIDSTVKEHEAELAELQDKRKRKLKRKTKKKNKKLRKSLMGEYGDEIKEMSVTRGKYLAKLVHRSTDRTIYALIKKYRSGYQAFFWQAIMKVYGGADLKSTYDASSEEDKILRMVVEDIENGTIKTIPRAVQKRKLLEKKAQKKKKK